MTLTTRVWNRPKTYCNSEPVLGRCSPFAPGEMLSAPNLCLDKFSLSFLLWASWKRLATSRPKLDSISVDVVVFPSVETMHIAHEGIVRPLTCPGCDIKCKEAARR